MSKKQRKNYHDGLVTVEIPVELWEKIGREAGRFRYFTRTQIVRIVLDRVLDEGIEKYLVPAA